MKAAGERNLSLVDAVHGDITASARLEARWRNRIQGEKSFGSGPSGYELSTRNEIRQVGSAMRYSQNIDLFSGGEELDEEGDRIEEESDIEDNGMYDAKKSHRPDKKAKTPNFGPKTNTRKRRSIDSKSFKTSLQKSVAKSLYTKVVSLTKRVIQLEVLVEESGKKYKMMFGGEIFCSCSPSQRADRRTCSHIIWVYLNLLKYDENDIQIAQIYADTSEMKKIISSCPEDVPENLKSCTSVLTRSYHHKLEEHPKFNDQQSWTISRKTRDPPARCSGCNKKNAIQKNDIHLHVDGLLYLRLKDKVVETTLRFCVKSKCVTNSLTLLF